MSFFYLANSGEEECTQFYYYYIFPADLIVRLFSNRTDSYNRKLEANNRELAIRLVQRRYGKTVFSRYYSPCPPGYIRSLMVQDIPTDVFIGAGYTLSPPRYKDNRAYRPMSGARHYKVPIGLMPFHAIHHEFVFDLDLSDYDQLRSCCKQRAICKLCWRFMAVACEALDAVLTIDLGVKHRLWLYSGGRGLHCWCFDKHMLTMNKAQRTALIDYIQGVLLPKDTDANTLEHQLRNHPSVVRTYTIGLDHMCDILQEQDCFSTQYGQQFLLDYIDMYLRDGEEEETVRQKIVEIIDAENELRTSAIDANTTGAADEQSNSNTSSSNNNSATDTKRYMSLQIINLLLELALKSDSADIAVRCIILKLIYPRIDVPVSLDITHLLRCPFSVHTSAGASIVLPLRPEAVANLFTDGILRLYPAGGVQHYRWELLWAELGATGRCSPNTISGRFDECKQILEELCEALEKEEGVDAQGNKLPAEQAEEVKEPAEEVDETAEEVEETPMEVEETPVEVIVIDSSDESIVEIL